MWFCDYFGWGGLWSLWVVAGLALLGIFTYCVYVYWGGPKIVSSPHGSLLLEQVAVAKYLADTFV